MLACVVIGIGAAWAPAQEVTPPAEVQAGLALRGVHIDTPGDGQVWVLASGYKARFGRDGVEFFPYFGANADRLHPLEFRLHSVRIGAAVLQLDTAVQPQIQGERIVYERGAVREVWDLRTHEVEQSFVVDSAERSGDLVIELDVASELRADDDADGLRFVHESLGCVHYGDVVAFDAKGRRVHAPSRLRADGIELRLGAAEIAAFEGSITVDPVVRAISVDAGSDIVGDAEVAFEPGTRNWLVVYTREFASTDSDILSRRFDFEGGLLEETVVATGSRESARPSVGANAAARQFLIAWDEDTGVADRVILGRTRTAASTTQSATFTVLDTSGVGNDDSAPRVGGSIATDATGSVYGVVCQSDEGNDRVLSFVRVTTSGSATRVTTLSGPGQDVAGARINRARANGEPWMCIYLQRHGGNSTNLHVATAPATGASVQRGVVDASFGCGLGGVAGRGDSFLAVYSQTVGAGNADIFARRLSPTVSGLVVNARRSLTEFEPGAIVAVNQVEPSVAFDGHRFTYVYAESTGSAVASDLYAAVVSVPSFVYSDGHHRLHATSAESEFAPEIASSGEMGGEVGRAFVAFTRQQVGGDPDVAGVLFDGTADLPGVTSLRTGCAGHNLVAENEPVLGAVLRLRATRTLPTNQAFLIGLRGPLLRLCTAGCTLAVAPVFVSTPGAELDLFVPPDLDLIGSEFAIQNIVVGVPGGCTPPSTPIELLTSPTLIVVVR